MKKSILTMFKKMFFSIPLSPFPSPLSPQKGFTLIELLVVMVLVITVGSIVLSVLSITLRGSKKADAILQVKQNGDFAMSQMAKAIRYARSLDSPVACTPGTTMTSMTITSLTDGGSTTFRCPANGNDPISSNSAGLIDTNAVSVSACSFTCSQKNANQSPTITIQYTLTTKKESNFFESKSTLPFQTSVTMRNVTQ